MKFFFSELKVKKKIELNMMHCWFSNMCYDTFPPPTNVNACSHSNLVLYSRYLFTAEYLSGGMIRERM